MKTHKVRIVNPEDNPSPKKKTKRKGKSTKMARLKRDKKGRFLPRGRGGGTRKKRRKNPGTTVARRAPARAAKRAPRRRNPEGGVPSTPLSFKSVWHGLAPAVLSRVWLAFAVRRWGGAWGVSAWSGKPIASSPFAGQQWTFQGYIVGLLATWAGAKAMNKWKPGWGAHFWRSGVENMVTRVVWTEFIARSAWGQQNFGQAMGAAFTDDTHGNRWLSQPGAGAASMQGLTPARPLDGLTPARPLDDTLAVARPVDRQRGGIGGRKYAQRRAARLMQRAQIAARSMGHYLPEGTDDTEARYHGSGAATAYHSAYTRAY